jgi:carboxypeptidase C (cathepsin A)
MMGLTCTVNVEGDRKAARLGHPSARAWGIGASKSRVTIRASGFAALALLFFFGQSAPLAAQEPDRESRAAEARPGEAKAGEAKLAEAKEAAPPKEESSVTDHTIRIGTETIAYKATASTTLLKDEKDEPAALLFSIAYTRSDAKDPGTRPVAFIYNGGPGSSSVWLHMGAFGPRRVMTANAQPTPPPPYKVADNNGCLLDKTDMVFIDPVGTGFSHPVGKAQGKDFWGIDQDVHSLAQFIMTWVTRNKRWNSSKFLMGESYGTFRSAALANYLHQHYHMDMNGIVLISTVLDIGTLMFSTGNDMSYVFYLPSYAAAAWVNKMLPDRPDDLEAFLKEARQFATTEFADALMKGSHLTEAEKAGIAKKLSRFTGLSEDYLLKANLRVRLSQFQAELGRAKGLTTGRYDARFTGPTYDLLAEHAVSDPSYTAVAGAFTAAINSYLREDLKFSSERTYEILGSEPGHNWDWKHSAPGRMEFFPGLPNVEDDLIAALLSSPNLQVQVENGYFDMATPFLATEYTMDHLLLPKDLRSRIHLEYYTAGHMMYLNDADHDKLAASVRAFVDSASK